MFRISKRNQFTRLTWFGLTLIALSIYIFVFSVNGAEKGWDGNKLGRVTTSIIDVSAPEILKAKESNPITALSPIKVIWHDKGTMVVQVYRQGNLIYPTDPHEEHGSGVTIPLRPGKHEIKVWVPNTGDFKSIWVMITQ